MIKVFKKMVRMNWKAVKRVIGRQMEDSERAMKRLVVIIMPSADNSVKVTGLL